MVTNFMMTDADSVRYVVFVISLILIVIKIREYMFLKGKPLRMAVISSRNAFYWSLSAFLWTILWSVVTPRAYLEECKIAYSGMAWPLIVLIFHILESVNCEPHIKQTSRPTMHWDANAITSLCFTSIALFADKSLANTESLTKMIVLPVIICLCLIVSMPHKCPDSAAYHVDRVIYRSAIIYSVGILMTVLSIRVYHPDFSGLPFRTR